MSAVYLDIDNYGTPLKLTVEAALPSILSTGALALGADPLYVAMTNALFTVCSDYTASLANISVMGAQVCGFGPVGQAVAAAAVLTYPGHTLAKQKALEVEITRPDGVYGKEVGRSYVRKTAYAGIMGASIAGTVLGIYAIDKFAANDRTMSQEFGTSAAKSAVPSRANNFDAAPLHVNFHLSSGIMAIAGKNEKAEPVYTLVIPKSKEAALTPV